MAEGWGAVGLREAGATPRVLCLHLVRLHLQTRTRGPGRKSPWHACQRGRAPGRSLHLSPPWKREGAAPRKREGAARLACKFLLYGFTVRGGVGIRMCPRERAFLGVPTPASGGELGLHGGGGARGTRSLVLGSLGSLQFIQRGPGGPLP